jgi:uncharacterized membrane protein
MSKNRLEAFSDGVIAIIITIMVLELKVPHGESVADLMPLIPVILSYILSFIYIGIYWNNHHHMFQGVRKVSGGVLWANMHLLFWLSLTPFVTAWAGENHFAAVPVALYGGVLMMSGVAYYILTRFLIGVDRESPVAKALRTDFKGKISVVMYAIAIPLAFVSTAIALAIYVGVAAMWFIPDRRMEKVLAKEHSPS